MDSFNFSEDEFFQILNSVKDTLLQIWKSPYICKPI